MFRPPMPADKKFWLWLLALGGLLSPIIARAASFDCSQAECPLEILICADAQLSSLDALEGQAYYALRSTIRKGSNAAARLLAEQREFLKNRTEKCPIADKPVLSGADRSRMIDCLKDSYTARLNELQKRLVPGQSDLPTDLLPTLQNDPTHQEEFEGCPESSRDDVDATPFALFRPQQAWLLTGNYPCLGGNDNWDLILYIRAGNRWRKILDDIG